MFTLTDAMRDLGCSLTASAFHQHGRCDTHKAPLTPEGVCTWVVRTTVNVAAQAVVHARRGGKQHG